MKPFTPIISKHIADEKTRFYVSTKRDGQKPIFGDRHSKTRWVVFLSPAENNSKGE